MTNEELIQKAIDLTNGHESRYHNELSDVNWVEKDGCSMDYSYCDDCIEKAVYDERREYLLEQRKLPVRQRDKKFSRFESTYNYGGGYEDDSFTTCEICGKSLDISIIPSRQELEELISDLEDGEIDNRLGWMINNILYNRWDKDKKSERYDLSVKLAERTINILQAKL